MTTDKFGGFPPPNFTQVPNELLEVLMPLLGNAELRVLLFIARKTKGWHKEDDNISLGQIMDGTGLSKPAIITAIASLEERGLIVRLSRGQNKPYNFRLNIQSSKDTLPEAKSSSKATLPDNNETSKATLPDLVKLLYPQKKDLNKEIKESSAANNAAPTQAALDLKGDEAIGVDDPQPQPQPETPKPNNLLHFKEKEGLSLTDDNPTQTPPPMPSTPSPSSADLFDALERAAPIARQKVSYGKGDVQDYYALLVKLNTGGWTVEQFNACKSAKVTGRFGKAAKRLRAKGCDLNIMADQYGAPEGFWWSTYWKGVKEKQYPEPEDIEDTWNDWLKVTAPTTKHATTPDAQPQVVPPSVLPRHRPEDDKEYADPAEVADMARQAKAILAEKIAEREARQALRRTA